MNGPNPNGSRHHLSAEELRDYEANGYLVLRQVLDTEARATLLEECMQAWRREKGPFEPDATWLQNALLTDIHHRSRLVRRFYFAGPLVDIAEQLIGPNVKGATSQLTFKLRGNTMPFGWHQDNGYGQLEPANAISTLTARPQTVRHTMRGRIGFPPGLPENLQSINSGNGHH